MNINNENINRGLVIDAPWIDLILCGKKVWEMRTRNTKIRGRIGLIKKGSGKIFGIASLSQSYGPLVPEDFKKNADKHCIPLEMERACFQRGWLFAWCLEKVSILDKPVEYNHKKGAIIWVKLDYNEL